MCHKILEKMSKFFPKKKLSNKFSKQFSTKNCQKLANPHCEVSASSFRPFCNMHPPLFPDPPRRRSWLLAAGSTLAPHSMHSTSTPQLRSYRRQIQEFRQRRRWEPLEKSRKTMKNLENLEEYREILKISKNIEKS